MKEALMADELAVNEVMAEMRALIGEQGQTIAMLRAALKRDKTGRPQAADQDTARAAPPTPTQEAI